MQNLVALTLMARYREISKVFPITGLCKTHDLRDGAKLDSMAIIWALLVEAH